MSVCGSSPPFRTILKTHTRWCVRAPRNGLQQACPTCSQDGFESGPTHVRETFSNRTTLSTATVSHTSTSKGPQGTGETQGNQKPRGAETQGLRPVTCTLTAHC